jgi:perosamine synthetase
MTTITLARPCREGRTVTISWSVRPTSSLYRATEFELVFPSCIDLDGVPDEIWWRVALLCLHTQWPLLRPCRVVLPVRLTPGERELWARLCDSLLATLEAHSGGTDFARRLDLAESGPQLETPDLGCRPERAVACFSGGRDSLTQTSLLQELGIRPLLVTVVSDREGSIEHRSAYRDEVMREIVRRRGLELVEVTSTLRGSWDNGFAAARYGISVTELTDTFLYFAAALAVAAATGAGRVFLASENELQETRQIGGRIVQHKHCAYSTATQRALSALLVPLGISYGGLTSPLRQFQVQRLLNKRYGDVADLQYSCWSMASDERACSRCGECRVNAFNLIADGCAPAEIGIDLVPLLQAHAGWRPRSEEADARLPNSRWQFDMQMVRCLEVATPARVQGLIERDGPLSQEGAAALAGYTQMRSAALAGGVEPEPGYRPGFLSLIDASLRSGVEAIFDDQFEREAEARHADAVARVWSLADWISAPLADPRLAWRPFRRPVAAGGHVRHPAAHQSLRPRPPDPAIYDEVDLAAIADLLPEPEPALRGAELDRIPVASARLAGNELRYVTECVRSGWISSAGAFVKRFESAFAQAAGCSYGVACTSGTTALHLALASAGIGPGDEVIVPAFTMIASANAVGYVGATPVLVDTDERTWNLDLELVRDLIGPRTRAILIVHTYGRLVDTDALGRLAQDNGLAVIEDAAEAHGAEFRGRRAGSLGTVAAFSFYGNKILTTGEGGMVTTNDPAIAAVARELRDHAFSPDRHFWHRYRGYNYRMTNLQAAVGLAQLERLDDLVDRRNRTDRLYREALEQTPGLELAPVEAGSRDAHWMFGALVGPDFGITRDELRRRLADCGIETRTFFVPIHLQPAYRKSQGGRRFPVAERLGRDGLYLPSGPEIGEREVARVSKAIAQARTTEPAVGNP